MLPTLGAASAKALREARETGAQRWSRREKAGWLQRRGQITLGLLGPGEELGSAQKYSSRIDVLK